MRTIMCFVTKQKYTFGKLDPGISFIHSVQGGSCWLSNRLLLSNLLFVSQKSYIHDIFEDIITANRLQVTVSGILVRVLMNGI